jgi:hypothetical protein
MGALSAVGEGVRPTQPPYLSRLGTPPPAAEPMLCRLPWEAECDGFAGEHAGRPPAQPTTLGKPTSGVGTPSSKLSLPDNPNPAPCSGARIKGCLNSTVKTPTYKSLQRESSLQKPPSNSVCNANRCKNLYGIILQRNVLPFCNGNSCKNLNGNILQRWIVVARHHV